MILAYGSYRHALGEVALTIQRDATVSDDEILFGWRETWSIVGRLHADTPDDLTAAIQNLEAAYRRTRQDVVLYLPDGTTASAHQMRNADTVGGIRVIRPPSFPSGRGAEYSTFRTYSIQLEADFLDSSDETGLLAWNETLNFSGGGPRWVYLPTLQGRPVRQQLQAATTFKVTQSGRAVGLRGYPTPPAPIWPTAWHQEQGGVTRVLPHRVGSNNAQYEVTWTYSFESADPLLGRPTPKRG
ncbi:MAG TPA: hypothetical protein VHZ24_20800 [Pirellulales bacterium]|nr:hypothetical protein [Pirellulales bacterium]